MKNQSKIDFLFSGLHFYLIVRYSILKTASRNDLAVSVLSWLFVSRNSFTISQNLDLVNRFFHFLYSYEEGK